MAATKTAGTVENPISTLFVSLLVTAILLALFAWPLMGALALFGVTLGYYQALLVMVAVRGVGFALGMK